jgi:antirestriction protein ArdC
MNRNQNRQDVYSRITAQIIDSLEKGVRPWARPWNAEHAAGPITRPLRHNGQPYAGINVVSLWASAFARNFTAPLWMTFRQALELGAHVRKGEKGSLVVYANSIVRTETDKATGDETERAIPFLKGYTVFNSSRRQAHPSSMTEIRLFIIPPETRSACRRLKVSGPRRAITPHSPTK